MFNSDITNRDLLVVDNDNRYISSPGLQES